MRVGQRSAHDNLQATARRIVSIRQALGFSQRDFSFYLRVSQNTVSYWETAKQKPSPLAEQAIRNLAAEHGLDLHTMRAFG